MMSDEPKEYLNNEDRWPDGLWPDEGPGDEQRCQYTFMKNTHCGLPVYAHTESGEPRCIIHYDGRRESDELQQQLQAMAAGGARMWDANLEGVELLQVNLRGAQLMDANLRNADLVSADLRDADLTDAIMVHTDLRFADLRGADLGDARIEGKADLRRANLAGARLTGVQIDSDCKLSYVVWAEDDGLMVLEEQEARAARAVKDETKARLLFNAAEGVYRHVKQSYQTSGDYRLAGEFFVREMEAKRSQLSLPNDDGSRAPWYHRGGWWLMYHLCGYGERPSWLVAAAGLMVIIFAAIHVCTGFRDMSSGVVFGAGADPSDSPGLLPSFAMAVYVSVVTFTSLGYGDVLPITSMGRMLSAIEVVLGGLVTSLILVAIVRKWSR